MKYINIEILKFWNTEIFICCNEASGSRESIEKIKSDLIKVEKALKAVKGQVSEEEVLSGASL